MEIRILGQVKLQKMQLAALPTLQYENPVMCECGREKYEVVRQSIHYLTFNMKYFKR